MHSWKSVDVIEAPSIGTRAVCIFIGSSTINALKKHSYLKPWPLIAWTGLRVNLEFSFHKFELMILIKMDFFQ